MYHNGIPIYHSNGNPVSPTSVKQGQNLLLVGLPGSRVGTSTKKIYVIKDKTMTNLTESKMSPAGFIQELQLHDIKLEKRCAFFKRGLIRQVGCDRFTCPIISLARHKGYNNPKDLLGFESARFLGIDETSYHRIMATSDNVKRQSPYSKKLRKQLNSLCRFSIKNFVRNTLDFWIYSRNASKT